ncbi:MAG: hypothetical protein ACOC9A_01860 [Candidatus Bipolaricaulota bacterium]
MVNYKRIPEEKREEFQEMLHYAFKPHKEEIDYHNDEEFWSIIGDPGKLSASFGRKSSSS